MGSECQWERENTFCILQLAVPKRPALLPPGHSGSHRTLRSPTMWAWHGMAACPPENCLINEQMIKHGMEWMIQDFKRHPHHHIIDMCIYILYIYTVPVPYINSIAHILLSPLEPFEPLIWARGWAPQHWLPFGPFSLQSQRSRLITSHKC